MEYSIKQIARLTGATSRTLRHYDQMGLLKPSRVAPNGYRYYDDSNVLTMQQILLLKRLGLSLDGIRTALDSQESHVALLETLLDSLHAEQAAISARITAVQQTIDALMKGQNMNANEALSVFNDQYKEEVIDRWGKAAFQQGKDWWQQLSEQDREEFVANVDDLNARWIQVWTSGAAPDSSTAQELAMRHVAWLKTVPGTPAHRGSKETLSGYVESLAHMYPADPRFAHNYGGEDGATFVRDALLHLIRA